MVELGHSKNDTEENIFNYAIAYDRNKREPLFYEAYPGSIVDVSQLQHTLKKAKSYGYEHVGFILGRGYFCKENILFMDDNGYDFVIMVKGMKPLVNELILKVQGSFENDRRNSIRTFKVSGTTIKKKLYATDPEERYFHIYYDDGRKATDREKFEDKIDRMGKKLRGLQGESVRLGGEYKKYLDLVYWHEGLEDEKFMYGIEKSDIINREIRLCGYFAIVTSAKMSAEEALILYKSRDESEKTFREDKSYLGAHCERVYAIESVDTKIFIGFVATIIRNRIYTLLKEEAGRLDKRPNFMTVPAALRELEKIEILKGADNEYNLDYAVTATQKTILNAFGVTADNVHRQAAALSSDLLRVKKRRKLRQRSLHIRIHENLLSEIEQVFLLAHHITFWERSQEEKEHLFDSKAAASASAAVYFRKVLDICWTGCIIIPLNTYRKRRCFITVNIESKED